MLDYKLIIVEQPNLVKNLTILDKSRTTGQNIQNLIKDANKLEKAILEWELVSSLKLYLTIKYFKKDFEQELIWLEDRFIKMLNRNVDVVRMTIYLKRQWNKDVKKARKTLDRVFKSWERRGNDPELFK